MTSSNVARHNDHMLSVLRIVAGIVFTSAGTAKLAIYFTYGSKQRSICGTSGSGRSGQGSLQ
jgi:hypothetical protein